MKFTFTIKDGVLEKYNAPILGCDSNVIVPEGVTQIAKSAFYYIRGIDFVELPNSVKRIGEDCFYMCEGMEKIHMPAYLEELGARAFAHCHRLEKIVIPEGVKNIYTNTFYKCENLQEVFFPRSLEHVESGAFSGCYILNKYYYMGTDAEWDKNVTCSVGRKLVVCLGYDESEKEKINLDDYIIEDGVLIDYYGDKTTVFVPDGVHTIASSAFRGIFRDNLMYRLILPEGVVNIEEHAFEFEELFTEIVIPKSLKSIPENAIFCSRNDCMKVIYKGTKEEWRRVKDDIKIENIGVVECLDGQFND